ncbi:kinase-like domain-containing protein [Dactylonectria estremocensis]|uniref:EKC/KEOPS complex subunit BUD32 n=1 Tax=Dactylonectria estremocensis TaxID=1079267 RepID=A0A9P9FBW5_9HYPO|nr:kinase-like domain-containing protein [Dactylonectria estremocensis]
MDCSDRPWNGDSRTPSPDPQRPGFPYRSGLKLTIRRHSPPPPYGVQYVKGLERKRVRMPRKLKVTQSEWCLQHPPEESHSPHPDTTTHTLRVLGEIACEDGRGAQVVRCCLDNDKSSVYAAKIYDARHYRWPNDVTWEADEDYRREAAAYEDMQQLGLDGEIAPKYFGSWTTNVVAWAGSDVLRPVRIVLMEFLEGSSMLSLLVNKQVTTIPPQQRLDILGAAIVAANQLHFHHIWHRDFSPRNIMLVRSHPNRGMPRVVLIDFNCSTVATRPNSKYPAFQRRLPANPINAWWTSFDDEFYHWIPEPHRSRVSVWKGWLRATWGSSNEFESPREEILEEFENGVTEFLPPLPDPEDTSNSRW